MIRRRERGLAMITFALSLILIVPAIGVGVDAAMLYITRERLNTAVQLAAHAARKASHPEETAKRIFNANFPDGFMGASQRTMYYGEKDVRAELQSPAYFMRLVGVSTVTVKAAANR